MPQEPEESASSALEAMASSLAFEVECAYDGLSAEKELSAAELSAKLTWTRSECTKLKKRRKNLAKEARRVEAEAAASKSAASALEARHAKLVEALSEKRARRDDVALERLTRERAARGPADEGPLRRRELHVALGDLERVRKELAHLDNNNETLRRELRKFQRASGFVEDVKDERESSEEEEEEPHLKPPQYAVATPIDVVHVSCEDLDDDASSSSGQQRHLLMTLRVLDDDDDDDTTDDVEEDAWELSQEREAAESSRQRRKEESSPKEKKKRRRRLDSFFRKPKRAVDGVITFARSVRMTGSKLPILFASFASETDAHEACLESERLAALNVTCFLAALEPPLGYGYPKIAAVAAVPAREVLWVDQDAWFVKNPDSLFDDTGYVTAGALFWPDLFDFFHNDDLVWETVGCGPDGRLFDCDLCRRLVQASSSSSSSGGGGGGGGGSGSSARWGPLEEEKFNNAEEEDSPADSVDWWSKRRQKRVAWKSTCPAAQLQSAEELDDDDDDFAYRGTRPSVDDDSNYYPWWDRLQKMGKRRLTVEQPPTNRRLKQQRRRRRSTLSSEESSGWCECPRSVSDERWNLTSRSAEWSTFSKKDWAARQGFDTGILLVDKSRVGFQIELTDHLARRGDPANEKWAKFSLGDKDLWHLAWMLSGAKYALSPYAGMVGSRVDDDLRFLLVSQAKLDARRAVVLLHQNWRSIPDWRDAALAVADLRRLDGPPFEGSGKDLLHVPVNFAKLTVGARGAHDASRPRGKYDDEYWSESWSRDGEPPHVFVTRPAPYDLAQSLADVRRVWEFGAAAFWDLSSSSQQQHTAPPP
mmetsp:Transcript_27048/g.83044  ORF Transcript_27048/g.83044 Transcript_27048/m.83044 type:complete len:820 (+) Transcript_27048:33-2492(+)